MTETIGGESPPRPPLPLLTSLRFFAAVEVVLFHFYFPVPTDFLRALVSAGFQAVTFFFVLSGFVLAYVHSGPSAADPSSKSPKAFWIARAGRILPAYWLGLAGALPLLAYGSLISHITPMPIFLASTALAPFLLQSFVPPVADAWNAPAWSLSVEMVFYALFPIILDMFRRAPALILLLASYGFLLVTQGFRELFHPEPAASAAGWNFYKFFPAFHLATFLFGVALGRFFLFGPRLSRRISTAMFVAASGGVILILGLRPWIPQWLSRDPMLVLIYGAIVFGAARPTDLLRPLYSRPMVLLGEASYGMYILHMPLLFWWGWLFRDRLSLRISPVADGVLFLLGVTVVSLGVLRHVEQPLRRMIVRGLVPTVA